MKIEIPDELFTNPNKSQQDMLLWVAIALYKEEQISLGKAAELAGIHRLEFQQALATHEIPINYNIEDLNLDMHNGRTAEP